MMPEVKSISPFLKECISWEQFRAIANAFADIPHVRLIYCEGLLEIMPVSLQHEMIVMLLNTLLMNYCVHKGIPFVATGAYTQTIPTKVEFQADLSFCFGELKEVSDLCIEVVISSGSVSKLRKYELRGVPEVWFWEEGKISIFYFQNGVYQMQTCSVLLPDLDINHLESCLLMESQLEAMQSFISRYC